MKAAIYTNTGKASDVLSIVELDKPLANENQVLVKLYTSGINPTDTKTRAGIFPIQGTWDKIIPHHDGAGIIEDVGENIPPSRIGERVWLHSAQVNSLTGTAAEYIAIDSDKAVPLPSNISFDDGATFGVPLLTAYRAVTINGSIAGKTLLIQGGAGAVGHYAIQIAKNKGAKVITTVSTDTKAIIAKEAGADVVINYRSENIAERVQDLTDNMGVDHLIEVNLSANALLLPSLVKNNGFVSVYGSTDYTAQFPAVEAVIQQLQFVFFIVFAMPPEVLKEAIGDITKMLSENKLSALINKRLPLQHIAQAHELQDSTSTIGNIILSIHNDSRNN